MIFFLYVISFVGKAEEYSKRPPAYNAVLRNNYMLQYFNKKKFGKLPCRLYRHAPLDNIQFSFNTVFYKQIQPITITK